MRNTKGKLIRTGQDILITATKKEFGCKLVTISDLNGVKIWNGSFTWFPIESLITSKN